MQKFQIDSDDKMIYPMGLTVTEKGIHVAVAAACKECCVLLFPPVSGAEPVRISFPREGRTGDVWQMSLIGGDFSGYEYCFEIDGKMTPDPYGGAFSGRETWGNPEDVGVLRRTPVQAEAFDWEGDHPLEIPYEECIVYRIHPRGFTRHSSSKVKHKGTFTGVIEKIPYMKELGITTVEMMPPAEFDEVMVPESVDGNPYGELRPTGRLNYWGYTRAYDFAPKASYCSGRQKRPVREFKTLVKELHRNGLELVIELFFDGKEQPSYVLDVARFWVREYHVDGIHLVGYAPAALLGEDPYLMRTKLWANSWDGVKAGADRHLGEYHDSFQKVMRQVLKGDEEQMNSLIFHTRRNPKGCGILNYIANTNGFTMMDMVSYDVKHNEANGENNCDGTDYNHSWNCGAEGQVRKKKVLQLRRQQLRNAFLLVFLSQGTPLLMAGDEFGNSKNGNNNSYCQDNDISWLNWNKLRTNRDLYEFARRVIAFRREHPVFHQDKEPLLMDYLACGYPDVSYHGVKTWCPELENFRRQLGIMYCGEYGRRADGSTDDYFYVAYNMHWEPHEFALPNLPKGRRWRVAFHTARQEINGFYPDGEEPPVEEKQFMVSPRTIVVFIGKQEPIKKQEKAEKP